MSSNAQQQGTWYLRILEGPLAGQAYAIDRSIVTVGQAPGNDIVLDVPGLTAQHIQLTYHQGWFYVQDLSGTGGVTVNNMPINGIQALTPGDRITLGGQVTLTMEWVPAAAYPPAAVSPVPASVPQAQAPAPQVQAAVPPPTGPSAAPGAGAQRSRAGLTGLFIGCGLILFLLAVVGIVVALALTGILPNPFVRNTATPTHTPPVVATLPRIHTPTTTGTATATLTPAPTFTPGPTWTATATATPAPTATETALPPTDTPPPPTATHTPTSLPPTNTPRPPTATPTATFTPTATSTPVPTATHTPAPLAINHTINSATCISTGRYRINMTIYVGGGTGQYIVYRDIESQRIYGPGPNTTIPYELDWGNADATGTLVVQSGGASAEIKFYVKYPVCP